MKHSAHSLILLSASPVSAKPALCLANIHGRMHVFFFFFPHICFNVFKSFNSLADVLLMILAFGKKAFVVYKRFEHAKSLSLGLFSLWLLKLF